MKITPQLPLPLLWLFLAIALPGGCSQDLKPADFTGHTPLVRVLIGHDKPAVVLTAAHPPVIHCAGASKRLDIPAGAAVRLNLTPNGWQCGNIPLGGGELTIEPSGEGTVAIDGASYRGRYRLVPVSTDRFDVVNDVDVDGYLKGVLPRELKRLWSDETYKAQAIVARTYAIYEMKTSSATQHFDLFDDQRSQVYSGISVETSQSRDAVDATAGMVVVAGPIGHERIFKAYFSSCCGGIGQSAADAFGDPSNAALTEQAVGTLCSESPRFNWGPIVVSKTELTARFRRFGALRNRAEQNMAKLSRIEATAANRLGRPVRFSAIDARGVRYNWTGEEFRWAVNTDAPDNARLLSSLVEIDNQPDNIRFFNGHGQGHGVGLCQWCAQKRAEMGWTYDAIVTAAFPGSRITKTY